MPGSSLSLDSLSSPSPSPSPPPQPASQAQGRSTASTSRAPLSTSESNQASNSAPAGLDSDSELSELTEDEQDTNQHTANDSKKRLTSRDNQEQEFLDNDKRSSASRRTAKTRRRKRSSIVPAPMWGWASKEQRALEAMEEEEASRQEEEEEEEEEEEGNGPPRAMEEEEDDDDEGGDDTLRGGRGQQKPHQPDNWRSGKGKPLRRSRKVSYRNHDIEEDDVLDDDDDDADPTYKRNNVSTSGKSRTNGVTPGDEELNSDEEARPGSQNTWKSTKQDRAGGEVSYTSDAPAARKPIVRDRRRAVTTSKHVEDEEEEEEEDPPSDGDVADTRSGDDRSGNETESDVDEASTVKLPPTSVKSLNSLVTTTSPSKLVAPDIKSPAVNSRTNVFVADTSVSQQIAVINAAAAASSIMAGSNIVGKDADHTSSAQSSREGSLVPSAKGSDDEDEREGRMSLASVSRKRRESLILNSNDADAIHSKADAKALDPDGDIEMDVEVDGENPDEANDHDEHGDGDNDADIDVDGEENDQGDGDPDGNDENEHGDNEDDLDNDNELESDIQPAHRAEALEVLANIELKFALLRERVYVEKMESLAWEEELVNEGHHPEMIYLHRELNNRREKRLELAERKRLHEIANIGKRRRAEEEATWSWWMFTRDELQTEMISETNGKRRRLERERRLFERPQPVRRIPAPPTTVPPAPSLRRVLSNVPFNDSKRSKADPYHSTHVYVYPELPTLASHDVSADLDYLLRNKRHGNLYDPHSGQFLGVPTNGSMHGAGGGMRNAYDPHQYAIGGVDPYGRPLPPPPSYSPYGHHQGHAPGPGQPMHAYPPYGAAPTPGPHHPVPPPSSAGLPSNAHNQRHMPSERERERRDIEMEMAANHPPGSGHQLMPNHPYFGQGRNGGPANTYPQHQSGQPQPNGRRRSPSPVLAPPGVDGPAKHGPPAPGTWLGPGMGMGYVPLGKADWGENRRTHGAMDAVVDNEDRDRLAREWEREKEAERDREKHRERERERERDLREKERARELHEHEKQREHYHAQHQHRQGPPHQHVHGPPPVPHHHHHRPAPHHHHVVHHHHSQPPSSHGPSPSNAHSSSSVPPLSGHNRPHPSNDPGLKSSWKGDDMARNGSADYRDREREHEKEREKEREGRMQPPTLGRPRSGPPLAADDRDRPAAVPLALGASQPPPFNNPPSGPQLSNGSSRGPWPPNEEGHRIPSSSSASAGYSNSQEPHRSPVHGYATPVNNHSQRSQAPPSSFQNNAGPSSPSRRPPPPPSPNSTYPPSSQQSPPRYGPPPPPIAPRSPPVSLKMRPPSPLTSKLLPPPNPTSAYTQSPRLNGPGRTLTPGSLPGPGHLVEGKTRPASPAPSSAASRSPMPFGPPPPSSTNGPDRQGSPHIAGLPPPPSKLPMSLPQMG